jgi:hypothetical protein
LRLDLLARRYAKTPREIAAHPWSELLEWFDAAEQNGW